MRKLIGLLIIAAGKIIWFEEKTCSLLSINKKTGHRRFLLLNRSKVMIALFSVSKDWSRIRFAGGFHRERMRLCSGRMNNILLNYLLHCKEKNFAPPMV
jgi:hypothetical protein